MVTTRSPLHQRLMQKPTEPRWLTYAELAELMNASTEAARAFANRLELRKQRGNDGKARVYIEPDVLASRLDRLSSGNHPDSAPGDRKEDSQINDLREHVNTLREHLDRQHADHQAEVTRLLDQIDRQREEIERARLEASRAREDAEHERGHTHTLFNQVKDLADRLAHVEAERARVVTELAQARQSWWRRLIGR
jgi:DNA repair exonuclease SbcCD ATPase subunit